MKELIRQGHDDRFTNEIQRLCLHWDLIMLCTYKCSYCYARGDHYGNPWGVIPKMDTISLIIDAISRSHLPLNLGLLGGEPTFHPRFFDVLDSVYNKCGFNKNYNTVNYIYIVSNGSRPLEWFKAHKEYPEMSYLWSFHPEFAEVQEFIEKVKVMRKKGFYNKVNILLHPNKKYWPKIEEAYKKLKDEGIKVHTHFIYNKVSFYLWDYSQEFWNWSKQMFNNEIPDIEFHYLENGTLKKELHNDFEVYCYELNKFKDFNCLNNNYEISASGETIMFCGENKKISLIKNPDFFEKIKSVEPIKCIREHCNCDGLLKVYKYRDGYDILPSNTR